MVLWSASQPHPLDAYMGRWWALAESYRYLRIKGGVNVVNSGKIG